MPNIKHKFTKQFRQVIKKAAWQAERSAESLSSRHILESLLSAPGTVAFELLKRLGLNQLDKLHEAVKPSVVNPTEKSLTIDRLPPTIKLAITRSVLAAAKHEHQYVGTEHLLAGLLAVDRQTVARIVKLDKSSLEELEFQLEAVLSNTSRFKDLTTAAAESKKAAKQAVKTRSRVKKMRPGQDSVLQYFAVDLTGADFQEKLKPVVGRADEIERVVQILARRDKNNPVLIGEPGVGKTAIIEGLAKRIHAGQVPSFLQNKRIFRLDLSLIVAGTMYRGEFEQRLKQVMDEVKDDDDLILFIDELHNIVGAGSAAGSMDAANILKPALARGEIRLIGATTLQEFKRHIEPDPALERRLQPVLVNEPTVTETVSILEGIKDSYERHHQVKISRESLLAAAELSDRYLPEKFLPDKAIDLIDEAAARVKVKQKPNVHNQDKTNYQRQLQAATVAKQKAVEQENFPQALALKEKERELEQMLVELESKPLPKISPQGEIDAAAIARLISQITKIPVGELLRSDRRRLLNLEARLNRGIIGQTEAVQALVEAIKRSKVGLSSVSRPLASFMFLGPSGVGKTETAKVLAQEVFQDTKALIRFDMSEFAEGFNISRLIGAPAGYVGYREGGQLTESVRRQPHSIVLFDEIEKAHPEIFNVLLQVLEDGHLSDATGKKVDFKNTIIILTSNIGLKDFNKSADLGFAESRTKRSESDVQLDYAAVKESVLESLSGRFRPEFLNRLDKLIVFKPLGKSELRRIAALELKKFTEADQQLQLSYDQKLVSLLAAKSLKPGEGARAIRRNLQDLVVSPLADWLLQQDQQPTAVKISVAEDKVIFS
jgi:ATP-dependent Clp protease ATP-binding subunit ClpC